MPDLRPVRHDEEGQCARACSHTGHGIDDAEAYHRVDKGKRHFTDRLRENVGQQTVATRRSLPRDHTALQGVCEIIDKLFINQHSSARTRHSSGHHGPEHPEKNDEKEDSGAVSDALFSFGHSKPHQASND